MWRLLPKVMLLFFVCMWVMVGVSMGQTLTTDEPAPQKLYEVLLKVLFPALWTVGGPWLQGLVTMGIKKVPPTFQVMISSVLSALVGGVAGVIPDFPLSIESAATMAAGGGATGQLISNLHPSTLQPKTAAVKDAIARGE